MSRQKTKTCIGCQNAELPEAPVKPRCTARERRGQAKRLAL